jgi:hypothetical protein
MALLNEANLAAEVAKRLKFRVHHVGTKLNAGELAELEALALKRGVTHGELIRGLILGEVAREKEPAPVVRPSVELEEITVLRLLLTNVLPKLATGETMTLEAYKGIVAEIKRRKTPRSLELVEEWQERGRAKPSVVPEK